MIDLRVVRLVEPDERKTSGKIAVAAGEGTQELNEYVRDRNSGQGRRGEGDDSLLRIEGPDGKGVFIDASRAEGHVRVLYWMQMLEPAVPDAAAPAGQTAGPS